MIEIETFPLPMSYVNQFKNVYKINMKYINMKSI